MTEQTHVHGVMLDVMGCGVLLTGPSGIGKSEIALNLIDRGHSLIADDSVCFTSNCQDELIGHCPELLQDFLEVRGLGILNIREMFGDTAIKVQKTLYLVVHFVHVAVDQMHKIDRLHGLNTTREILGRHIPQVSVPVAPGRNLSILVECAVRNQVLKNNGYHASEIFENRQRDFIGRNTT